MLRGGSDDAEDLVGWGGWSIAGVAKWGREARASVKTDVGATEGATELPECPGGGGISPWEKEGAGLPKTSSVVLSLVPGRCSRRGVASGSVKMSSGISSSRWRFDGLDKEYPMDLHLALFSDASSMSVRIRLGPSVGKAGSWGDLVITMVWIHT